MGRYLARTGSFISTTSTGFINMNDSRSARSPPVRTSSVRSRRTSRFPYRPITDSDGFRWPDGSGLAVYLGFNLEHFAFGEGLGAALGPVSPQPDVLNYSWREYGNRVGAWRCIDLFDALGLPSGTLINTALYEHCPELIEACVRARR